jgi:uncharacterized protein
VSEADAPVGFVTVADYEERALRAVDVATVVAEFAEALRRAGLMVTPDRTARFAAAINVAAPTRVRSLRHLGRTTLVSSHGQLAIFDRVFDHVFSGFADPISIRGDANSPPPIHHLAGDPRSSAQDDTVGTTKREQAPPAPMMPGTDNSPAGDPSEDGDETVLAAMSDEERLRHQEFAAMTPAEWARLQQLMTAFTLAAPERISRRTRRHRSGDALDLRATLRRSHRTAGDPVNHERRRRRTRTRRVVFLCDISGSMTSTSRAYLHLLHSAVRGAQAEAFVFATRLTRLTPVMRAAHPDAALRKAGELAPDWSGGTRIGAAIGAFNDGWGRRGMARGAVIVIVSDGWEREDPAELGEQMARLARLAHRVIWVNPRSAAPGWKPLVGGMAAAHPHIDHLISGHSLAALDDVIAAIAAS